MSSRFGKSIPRKSGEHSYVICPIQRFASIWLFLFVSIISGKARGEINGEAVRFLLQNTPEGRNIISILKEADGIDAKASRPKAVEDAISLLESRSEPLVRFLRQRLESADREFDNFRRNLWMSPPEYDRARSMLTRRVPGVGSLTQLESYYLRLQAKKWLGFRREGGELFVEKPSWERDIPLPEINDSLMLSGDARKFAESVNQFSEHRSESSAVVLLENAKKTLNLHGTRWEEILLPGSSVPALKITEGGPLGAAARRADSVLPETTLIYAPGLFVTHPLTGAALSPTEKIIYLSHESILAGRPDPMFLHELLHLEFLRLSRFGVSGGPGDSVFLGSIRMRERISTIMAYVEYLNLEELATFALDLNNFADEIEHSSDLSANRRVLDVTHNEAIIAEGNAHLVFEVANRALDEIRLGRAATSFKSKPSEMVQAGIIAEVAIGSGASHTLQVPLIGEEFSKLLIEYETHLKEFETTRRPQALSEALARKAALTRALSDRIRPLLAMSSKLLSQYKRVNVLLESNRRDEIWKRRLVSALRVPRETSLPYLGGASAVSCALRELALSPIPEKH